MKNMASCASKSKPCLKYPKTYKEVSGSTKPKLKELCRALTIDFEKSIGKKALVNVVCNALNISTSGSVKSKHDTVTTKKTDIPSLACLQKLKDWQKSLKGVPLMMEEWIVKNS